MKIKKKTFNEFCANICDGLYDPKVTLQSQSSGYRTLRYMIKNNISPATIEEMERWEKYPNMEELVATPDLKYLRAIHPTLRPIITSNWDIIKTLEI